MLNRRIETRLGIFVLCFFLLYSAALYNKTLSGRHPSSLLFLQEIVVLALIVHTASVVNLVFNDELRTNRMKLWVTAPVSKAKLFLKYIIAAVLKLLLNTAVWAAVIILVFFIKYRMPPANMALVVAGVLLTTAVLALSVAMLSVLIKGNLSLALTIIVPWLLSVVQLDPNAFSLYGSVVEKIMPVAVGVKSIYCGVFPLINSAEVSPVEYVYPVVWSLSVWFVLLYIITRKSY